MMDLFKLFHPHEELISLFHCSDGFHMAVFQHSVSVPLGRGMEKNYKSDVKDKK